MKIDLNRGINNDVKYSAFRVTTIIRVRWTCIQKFDYMRVRQENEHILHVDNTDGIVFSVNESCFDRWR